MTSTCECTVRSGKELGSDDIVQECLQDYSSACTTRIIGIAAEECKRIAYDPDQVYGRHDVMDPDFPQTIDDSFEEDMGPKPEQILVDLCNTRIETIVRVMGEMEFSWVSQERKVEDSGIASRLWKFAKEDAVHHILTLYGEGKSDEFSSMGDDLFS